LFQLLLLIVVAVAALYSRGLLLPLQEAMRIAMGLSDNQTALLQGLPIAIGVIVAMPFGVLSDRRSRARLVCAFALLGLVANLLTAWAPSFALLFIARSVAAFSASANWTCVLSLVASWYLPAQRGRATMAVSIGALMGMSAAFALGGVLLAFSDSAANGWRWAMLGLSVPLAAVLPLMLVLLDPARDATDMDTRVKGAYRQLWALRPTVVPLAAGFALVGGIADGAFLVWAGPTLIRSFGLSAAHAGVTMASILLLAGLSGPVIGGALADIGQRTGGPRRTAMILMSLLVLSVPAGLFAFAPSATVAIAMLAVFLVCGVAFAVALLTLTTIVIPSHLHSSSLALFLAISTVSSFAIAPLAVSELSALLGGEAMIGRSLTVVCMIASALGAVIFGFARRTWRAAAPETSARKPTPRYAGAGA